MKRIVIEGLDETYFAKPLTLGQLEQLETEINGIAKESAKFQAVSNDVNLPVGLLRRMANIVLVALRSHDESVSEDVVTSMSTAALSQAFSMILTGSGLVEVPSGKQMPKE